jgi:pectinesterase
MKTTAANYHVMYKWIGLAVIAAVLSGCNSAGTKTAMTADRVAPDATGAKVITVATEGKADFKTVQEALASIPDSNTPQGRTVIHLRPGRYVGPIMVAKTRPNVTFEGEGADKTFITYTLNVYETEEIQPMDKVRVSLGKGYAGTGVVVLGNGFHARDLTFENTSGDHGQALALRIDGDKAVITNCRLTGWQDTLMLNKGRQYFVDCYIEGRVDFIYGSATAVFENCQIHSRNGGHVTAASTPQENPYGFVFINCKLTGDPKSWRNPAAEPKKGSKPVMADLGRPWRPYASVTYINCRMGDHITPQGWNNWGRAENEKTARYSEYNSRTPGGKPLDVSKRAAWSKQLSKEEAEKYTAEKVFGDWNPAQ